jgi:hypothetical protein
VIAIESAQRTNSLIERAGFEFSIVLEMDQEIEDFPAAEIGDGRRLWKMSDELANPAEIGYFRSRPKSFEVDKPDIVLIPFSNGEFVFSGGRCLRV